MRTTLPAVAVATLTTMFTAALGAPAHAETRTLSGATTGDADTFLTYVGCDGVFDQGAAPQSRINLGPYSAPLGRRSLGIVPAGAGSASGPYSRFGSIAGLDASLSVAATAGSQGVSYVVAITQDSPAGTAWAGRAGVSVPAGGWTHVSTASLTYDWTLVDLASRRPVSAAGSATPAAFTAQHGDGAGFVVTGFGCDSRPFNLDAVRAGGSTFDFEGLSLTTTVGVAVTRVTAGQDVTVTGRVTDGTGRVTGDPLVLESRTGIGAWTPVGGPELAGPDGLSRVVVPLTETTELRWHRPQSQYADEGWSDVVTVTVTPAEGDKAEGDKPEDRTAKVDTGKK